MWPQLRDTGPQGTRGGVWCKQDGGRCIVTLVGHSGDFPAKDEAGFLASAASLASPAIADFVRTATPVSPNVVSRTTISQFWRYDAIAKPADRFLTTGDAVGAFNPVYGQGMTAAALSAQVVGPMLADPASDAEKDLTGFTPSRKRRWST